MRAILRTPRLYRIYSSKIEELRKIERDFDENWRHKFGDEAPVFEPCSALDENSIDEFRRLDKKIEMAGVLCSGRRSSAIAAARIALRE